MDYTSLVLRIIYIFINSYIIGLEIILIMLILFLILKKYNPLLKNIHKISFISSIILVIKLFFTPRVFISLIPLMDSFVKEVKECMVFATCVILLYYQKISLTFFIAMTYYIYRYNIIYFLGYHLLWILIH